MNYLAHLLLTQPTPQGWAGSLLPDLLRGKARRQWTSEHPQMAQAVEQHRFIDRFTDAHMAFQASCNCFRPAVGKLAGVVCDVAFDHCLTRQWDAVTQQVQTLREHATDSPLPCSHEAFVQQVYCGLHSIRTHMPDAMQRSLQAMQAENWLLAYASDAGMQRIFHRMSRRFTYQWNRPIDLMPAAEALQEHRDTLDALFATFWQDLIHALATR